MRGAEWDSLFSPRVFVPVQAAVEPGAPVRTVLDWRGIPLAAPYRFDAVGPGERLPVVKVWQEDGHPFLKLAHPAKGTTVDYAIRCLFNPEESGRPTRRIFAFLEIARGCPGGGTEVPVWTVVEVFHPATVGTLASEEIEAQRPIIDDIVDQQLGTSLEALEAMFGEMPLWENPDWGDEGNVHRVCLRCLQPVADHDQYCWNCGRMTA